MIPTGLQALMEASMVLQQQASQTAPGPQGQQPTVASQVMQQAQQASQPQMPQMQDIGKQAGIAGQLMAQRQQQQQQMAQNPEAIAQMAAQMLQQKGVAGLPSNMQFRDGGIIGYNGEGQSDVEDPEAGLSMAERAERQRREKGSIYDPYYGLPPGIREAMRRDEEARREGRASPESIPVPGPGGEENIPRAKSEREAIEAEQRDKAEKLRVMQLIQQRRAAQRAGVETALPVAQQAAALSGGAKALEDYYKPYPPRGQMKTTDSKPSAFEETMPDEVYAEGRPIPRVTSTVAPPPSAAAPAGMDASDASLGGTKPAGIAALQRAELPKLEVKPSTESPQMTAARQQLKELRDQRIAAAERQEDLTPQGIAALQAAQSERKKLLESSRGRDTYERLNALFTSMRTLGNEVGNVQRAIHAREEAAVTADLLHADSVLKLKQAQQAKELGKLDQAIALRNAGVSEQQESEKILALRDKNAADMALAVYGAQSREATHFADRANAMNMKLIELKQQADIKNEDRLLRQAINLQSRLNATLNGLNEARLKLSQELKNSAEFKAIESLKSMESKGLQLSPEQKKQLKEYEKFASDKEAEVVNTYMPRLQVLYKELGVEMPQAPARTTTSAVSFSSLPTK